MSWRVSYHHEVAYDLESLGAAAASRIMRVIDQRLRLGEPDKTGRPLAGVIAGYRRIRVGDTRIVYRVHVAGRQILIIAVGPRRREEVYKKAGKRHR